MGENVKLTNKQHEKDSEVYGAIMAGAKSRKKRLCQTIGATETPSGMCAIGAGNRGRKVTQPSDIITKGYQRLYGDTSSRTKHQLVPLVRFATANGVSENYAAGVNDGFENDTKAAKSFYQPTDTGSLDYLRGWHVGQTVLIESKAR